jgi:hypothetical protein
MGYEAANLHLATSGQRANVILDLNKRKPDWLLEAAKAMAMATEKDWQKFRSSDFAGRD